MGNWVFDYIQDVFRKNIRIHLQAHSNLLPLLFAFSHQNYVRYLTQHHVELTNLSFTKPQAFLYLETSGPGDLHSLSVSNFSTIPGDFVTEVAINRGVKIMSGPMRGGHSASINVENDFILNSHMLAKLK